MNISGILHGHINTVWALLTGLLHCFDWLQPMTEATAILQLDLLFEHSVGMITLLHNSSHSNKNWNRIQKISKILLSAPVKICHQWLGPEHIFALGIFSSLAFLFLCSLFASADTWRPSCLLVVSVNCSREGPGPASA